MLSIATKYNEQPEAAHAHIDGAILLGSSDALVFYLSPSIMSHQKRLMRILTTRETISFWIVVLQTSPKRNYQISNVEVATLLFTQSFWAVLLCFYAAETKYNETLVAAHCYTDNV